MQEFETSMTEEKKEKKDIRFVAVIKSAHNNQIQAQNGCIGNWLVKQKTTTISFSFLWVKMIDQS